MKVNQYNFKRKTAGKVAKLLNKVLRVQGCMRSRPTMCFVLAILKESMPSVSYLSKCVFVSLPKCS